MSQTQRVLSLNGKTITLIGTAHVSAESITEVENTIRELKPDSVAIELDDKRADSIKTLRSSFCTAPLKWLTTTACRMFGAKH